MRLPAVAVRFDARRAQDSIKPPLGTRGAQLRYENTVSFQRAFAVA